MSVISVHPRSGFVATVAHELRGPLTALEATSEVLSRDFDLLDRHELRTMISAIHRRALWLHELMENLMYAGALGEGRWPINRRPLDIRDVIAEVRPLVEPLLDRKEQRLRIRIEPALPLVAGDAKRLTQVLVNLVANASKYSRSGVPVDLVAKMRARNVRVTVADRGPGLPNGKSDELFEAYNRGGRTDGDGLGLGLSVVRSIIEAHSGAVGARNRKGGGASFWFEIAPLSADLDEAPASQGSVVAERWRLG